MLVKHIAISHFRGIDSLNWHVDNWLVCLIGHGDSTKTSILDAVELTLLPRWFVPFSDADFYKADTKLPICIEVTLGQLTDEIVHDDCCGLFLRGYKPFQPIHDDPEDGYEEVVTVRLRVADDLEPHWELVKDNGPEPKALTYRDRERFCMARLGDDIERHLTWSRGSALARITEKSSNTTSMLAVANRATNEAIRLSPKSELQDAASKVRETAKLFGVQLSELSAGLDVQSSLLGSSALSLHDDRRIPVRANGLGSRRLTGLAIQHDGVGRGSVLLIDEIEHGLEPHRIRRLIKKLSGDRTTTDVPPKPLADSGQVMFTTHSPTPIMSLDLSHLRFVRSNNGTTTIERVDSANLAVLQPVARSIAHAFLARKIVVCEGKTEEAICRVFDDVWAKANNGESFAYYGVVPVCGVGRTQAPDAAQEIKRLGYDVAYFGDSDEPLSIPADKLKEQGIAVFLWPDNMAIEERACADLPLDGLQEVINLACEIKGAASVCAMVANRLGKQHVPHTANIQDWIKDGNAEKELRIAIGKTAKSKTGDWFKNISDGESFGRIICNHLSKITNSPLSRTLKEVGTWTNAG